MPADKRTRLKEWLASGEARLCPLALPQRELWENSVVPVSEPAHHIGCIIKVSGLIVPDDCRVAMQRVVERQEALRISFLPGKEQPLQLVRKTGEANIHFRDLTPAEATPDGIEEVARELFARPFDLVQGPLYRADVLKVAANDHAIVLSMHHAIADGWTLGVFVRDLCGAYLQGMMGMHEPLPLPEQSYTAWGAADRAYWTPAELAQRAEYWRKMLAPASSRSEGVPPSQPEAARFASPRDGGTPSLLGSPLARFVSEIASELTTAARALARRTGATLFSTLLAAFQITLARRTLLDDLTVGAPVANRGKPNTRETMGYFSGVVPLRGRVDGTQTVSESLRATHQATVDGFANAMPFCELVKALGLPSTPTGHPVYDVRFALQNHPVPDVSVPQLSARLRMRSTGTPRCDLGCEITETGETLEVVWLFRENRFSPDDIRALHAMFQQTLAGACDTPEGRVSDLMK